MRARMTGAFSPIFFRLITKESDCLRRTLVAGFAREQVAHVGTCFGYAKQSGLPVDHVVKLFSSHLLGVREIANQARIEVA